MEQQEANYKVNIDTADLQSQLAQIRGMLDQTFQSQMLTADVPNPQPSLESFPAQQFNNAIGIAGNSASGDANGVMTSGSKLLSGLDLGMQKFRENNISALMSSGPDLAGPIPSERYIPNFKEMGPIQSLAGGVFGAGYSPTMSMTRGSYKERASERFGHEALGFGLELGGMGLGSIAGSMAAGMGVGGPVGALVGAAVSAVVKPVLDATVLRDYNNASEIKSYARDTSWRFLSGKFTRDEASEVGKELATIQRSDKMVGDRVGAQDVQRLLGEFTEAGAFDFVRSAQEYTEKAKGLIENHRKVMHLLRVSEQEAVAAWSVASTEGQAAALGAMAYSAGMTSSELMQWGSKGMEMVRGTGIDMNSAREGSMRTIVDVTEMRANGTIDFKTAQQLGGIEGISGYMQQAGYNWGNSWSGFTSLTAAGAYGGDFKSWITSSPIERMSASLQQNAGIGNFIENVGDQANAISKLSPDTMFAMQGLQYLQEMQYYTGNGATIGGLNENKFVGWMKQKYGMADPQARLYWQVMNGKQEDATANAFGRYAEGYNSIIDNHPGVIDTTIDTVSNAFSSIGGALTGMGMAIENWGSEVLTSWDDSIKELATGRKKMVSSATLKHMMQVSGMSSEQLNREADIEAVHIQNRRKNWLQDTKGGDTEPYETAINETKSDAIKKFNVVARYSSFESMRENQSDVHMQKKEFEYRKSLLDADVKTTEALVASLKQDKTLISSGVTGDLYLSDLVNTARETSGGWAGLSKDQQKKFINKNNYGIVIKQTGTLNVEDAYNKARNPASESYEAIQKNLAITDLYLKGMTSEQESKYIDTTFNAMQGKTIEQVKVMKGYENITDQEYILYTQAKSSKEVKDKVTAERKNFETQAVAAGTTAQVVAEKNRTDAKQRLDAALPEKKNTNIAAYENAQKDLAVLDLYAANATKDFIEARSKFFQNNKDKSLAEIRKIAGRENTTKEEYTLFRTESADTINKKVDATRSDFETGTKTLLNIERTSAKQAIHREELSLQQAGLMPIGAEELARRFFGQDDMDRGWLPDASKEQKVKAITRLTEIAQMDADLQQDALDNYRTFSGNALSDYQKKYIKSSQGKKQFIDTNNAELVATFGAMKADTETTEFEALGKQLNANIGASEKMNIIQGMAQNVMKDMGFKAPKTAGDQATQMSAALDKMQVEALNALTQKLEKLSNLDFNNSKQLRVTMMKTD